MLVNDDGSELTRGTWYSRLARERLDLSVSVEETLGQPRREQRTWQEELKEQTNGVQTTHGHLLFPPRLSLKSRPFPVVDRTGSTRMGKGGMANGLQSTAPDRAVLTRFAQRLTSSLATLEIPEACVIPPEPVCENFPFLASDPDTFQASDEPLMNWWAPSPMKALFSGAQCEATTTSFSLESLGVTRPLPPVPSFTKCPQSGHRKRRLAGCAVRVRLETAPIPVAVPKREQTYYATPHTPEVARLKTRPADLSAKTSAHLPITDLRYAPVGATSAHLPIPERSEGLRKPPMERTFGCSVFESGQSDVTVANSAITAASVVLVTLTENPGPVVLQYVSLQPGMGFTLHLTAPVVRKTAFNYLILVGELFQSVN